MIATVSVLACTKVLVTLFEASVPGSSFNPKQIAAGVWYLNQKEKIL